MSMPSISPNLVPQPDSSLWLNFDPHEDEKQLWLIEQEVFSQIKKVDQKSGDQLPIGKSNEVKQTVSRFDSTKKVAEHEEEDEDEDDDNDDEEVESHDDDDEEEIDMEVAAVEDELGDGDGPSPNNS